MILIPRKSKKCDTGFCQDPLVAEKQKESKSHTKKTQNVRQLTLQSKESEKADRVGKEEWEEEKRGG